MALCVGSLTSFVVILVLWFSGPIKADLTQPCVYTIYGWTLRSAGQQMPADTICGIAWTTLLKTDAARLIVTDNQLWLMATQQYVVGQLNQRTALLNGANATLLQAIQRALMLLGDGLQRACGNVSQWVLDEQQQGLLTLITAFSHGLMPDITPACSDEFIDSPLILTAQQYWHGDDVIVLRDPETNQTLINSLVNTLYATEFGLYALNALPLLLAFALGAKLAMYMDWRHKYTLNKRVSAPVDGSTNDYEMGEVKSVNHVDINGSGTESSTVSITRRIGEETFDEEISL